MSDERDPNFTGATPPPPPPDAAAAAGLGMSPTVAAPPIPPVAPAPVTPTPVAQPDVEQPNMGKRMLSGMMKALGGTSDVTYSVNPDGKLVATHIDAGPGSFFKRMLAGALTGAGAGGEAARRVGAGGGGIAGLGAGFSAERDDLRYQDQLKRKQAQEDFTTQQATMVRKAQLMLQNQQIAESTWRTMREKAEFDNRAAASLQAADQEVAKDPRNKSLGLYPSFNDFVQRYKADLPNLKELISNGTIRALPKYQDGKLVGMQIYEIHPAWAEERNSEPVQMSIPDGVDAKGAPKFKTITVPSGGMTNSALIQAQAQNGLNIQKQTESHAKGEAEIAEKKAQTAKAYAEANKANAEAKAAQLAASNYGIPTSAQGEDVLKALPPNQQASIRGLVNYEIDPNTFPTRTAKGTGQMDRATAIGLAKRADSTYDETQYKERSKTRADYAPGGKVGGNLLRINTAVHHINKLQGDMDALGNTWSPDYNSIANWMSQKLGRQAVTNFRQKQESVAGELAGLVKGGNASATDQEIDHWKESFNVNMSPEQFNGWVKGGLHLMAGRLAAVRAGWESSMKKPSDFSLISPQARAVLQKLPGGDEVLQQIGITGGGAGGGGNVQAPPPGATMKVPGTDGKMHWSDGQHDLGVAE